MTRLPLLTLIAVFSEDYIQGPFRNLIVPGDCDLPVKFILICEINSVLISDNHSLNWDLKCRHCLLMTENPIYEKINFKPLPVTTAKPDCGG